MVRATKRAFPGAASPSAGSLAQKIVHPCVYLFAVLR